MGTQYEGKWTPNRPKVRLSNASYQAFEDMIESMVAAAEDPKGICEVLKGKFGDPNTSSSLSFATGDLWKAMAKFKDDAPKYLAALWDGISYLSEFEDVPEQDFINSILEKNGESCRLDDDRVVQNRGDIVISATEFETPSFSNHYQQKEQIGVGGFGVVYRVEKQTEYGTFEFAIKFFEPSAFNNNPNATERFKREISVLNKLQHVGIVPVLEGGIASDGRPYYLMPLIRGKNIRDALEGASVLEVAAQYAAVARAIEFIHAKNVLHRDLKPTNILVRDSDRQVIVVDFGTAFLLDNLDEHSLTLANVGSPGYIPQEVVNNPKNRSPQHDIFSLGITLYETLARERPDMDNYMPLADVNDSFGVFDSVVEKAIAPALSRFKTMAPMREALEQLAGERRPSC